MTELSHMPQPASKRIAIHILPAAERAIRRGHPWLYDRAIRVQSHEGRPGDLAVIFDRKDRFLAVGLYDPGSPIRVRLLQHNKPATIDEGWFKGKILAAARLRSSLPKSGTTGYRLIHGENDGLPGLVVDRYEKDQVIKLYTLAWVPYLSLLSALLSEIVPADRHLLRLSRDVKRRAESPFEYHDGQLLKGRDAAGDVLFHENGLRFEADLLAGQKTGFFFDQRENRARVGKMIAADASIKRILDVFSYSGGFSLYAARAGASVVVSLDGNEPALKMAERNFELNQNIENVASSGHQIIKGDAFQKLRELGASKELFDMIVVDPPAFARNEAQVEGAMQAYSRLVTLALPLMRSGGTLVMASCSTQVTAERFFAGINEAANKSGRPLREIIRTGHPADHPISFPQGSYLKALFAMVT